MPGVLGACGACVGGSSRGGTASTRTALHRIMPCCSGVEPLGRAPCCGPAAAALLLCVGGGTACHLSALLPPSPSHPTPGWDTLLGRGAPCVGPARALCFTACPASTARPVHSAGWVHHHPPPPRGEGEGVPCLPPRLHTPPPSPHNLTAPRVPNTHVRPHPHPAQPPPSAKPCHAHPITPPSRPPPPTPIPILTA